MIIYRVENENGDGPWYNTPWDHIDLNWDDDKKYPGPCSDEIINCDIRTLKKIYDDELLFGCHTIELIFHWFYKCSKLLFENNFDIKKYEIDEKYLIIGKYQTIFCKSKAKKIN